jgi:hypothetical protein
VDSDEREADPESINYVVSPNGLAHGPVDYDRPLWLIEIEYRSNITQHIVNADSEIEARDAAVIKAAREGEEVLMAESIRVSFLEPLTEKTELPDGA